MQTPPDRKDLLRVERLTNIYKAMLEIHQSILRLSDESDLFPAICRTAVELGGVKLAWVGKLNDATGLIEPVASYGSGSEYLDHIIISADGGVPEGRGPTGTAFRESRIITVNNYGKSELTKPWRQRAEQYGWKSAGSFPIQRGGKPFAVLTVYQSYHDAFDDEATGLLGEMSRNISLALDSLDRETQRMEALEALRRSEERYRQIVETINEGIWSMDAAHKTTFVNPAMCRMLGYRPEEMLGRPVEEFLFRADLGDHQRQMEARRAGHHGPYERQFRRKDGSSCWCEVNPTAFMDDNGVLASAFALVTDITERKISAEAIWRQANFDSLTSLPNRALFYDRLEQEIKKAHRAGRKMALMFIDLDRFKEVNDTLGHSVGDMLLTEAAQRISACVREADTVARLGGDEFTVILSGLETNDGVERVAEDILNRVADPFRLKGEVLYVSASIGITLYPDDATEVEELVRHADQAMYVAKNGGRNRFGYFTQSLQRAAQNRLQLTNDLRRALAAGQFKVYYQPIVDLATGRTNKAEALIRLQHPLRGTISPSEFIPVAEDTGLIVDIGDWMFKEAARQLKHWRALYNPALQVSVNKSPTQFRQSSNNGEKWLDYLQELGLPGQSIVIEITEGLLLDTESGVTDKLLEFRDAGLQVSIDDFGTGYSSLSYLKKFDIDYLKIDQSFVRNLATDSNDMALSEAIIVMAHKLGLKVIAEGVETEAQRRLLSAAGCDYAQGYLFSKPLVPEEFETLLRHEAG